MISEAAGAGVIRQDVQQAIETEMRYRLGEGDAPGALSRWQKELLLLVIHTVKANACLSQLHARAAIKAGATLAQVLQVIQYVELSGMVKWVMVGHDALAAAYADDPRALKIAAAARRLDELRNNWLNPSDLVMRVPEVVEGYPDRILPKDEAAARILKTRTLTNLYNERPAWLAHAHRALDEAVAQAYGWPPEMSEEAMLAKLLALNVERAQGRPEEARSARARSNFL